MADTGDLKSPGSNTVRVRVPSSALFVSKEAWSSRPINQWDRRYASHRTGLYRPCGVAPFGLPAAHAGAAFAQGCFAPWTLTRKGVALSGSPVVHYSVYGVRRIAALADFRRVTLSAVASHR